MPSSWHIEDAQPCHVRMLAKCLRDGDSEEIMGSGSTPQRSLWYGYRNSIVRHTAFVDDDIAAMFGVAGPLFGPVGNPWLLTSPAIERLPWPFAREARRITAEWLSYYPRLENFVLASYDKAVGFIQVLGYEVDDDLSHTPSGVAYRRFWMQRSA